MENSLFNFSKCWFERLLCIISTCSLHWVTVLRLNFEDFEQFPNNRAITMTLEGTLNKLKALPLHHQMLFPELSKDPDRHLRHRTEKTERSWIHFKCYFTKRVFQIFFNSYTYARSLLSSKFFWEFPQCWFFVCFFFPTAQSLRMKHILKQIRRKK